VERRCRSNHRRQPPPGKWTTAYISRCKWPTRSSRHGSRNTRAFDPGGSASYSALAIGSEDGLGRAVGNLRRTAQQRKKMAGTTSALPALYPLARGRAADYHTFPRGPQPGTFLHGSVGKLAGERLRYHWLDRRTVSNGCARAASAVAGGSWTEC